MDLVYAMIPARGGSRGIPRKNLAELGGKPLIAHTIEAALASRWIHRVMVSTEDDEIADVARRWGAEIPFKRPVELATDTAGGNAVSRHWLEWVRDHEPHPWAVVHLQATSPLRGGDDIDAAIGLLKTCGCDCVATVCPVSEHPAYMYRVVGNRAERFLADGGLPDHRQGTEPLYRLNGAIYATRFEAALKAGYFHVKPFAVSIMPAERSIDIDTPIDLTLAEALFRRMTPCAGRGGC